MKSFNLSIGKTIYKKSFTLGQEILPILNKIFGEYHKEISHHMFELCKLLLKQSDVEQAEKLSFIEKTRNHIKITHGSTHSLYSSAEKLESNLQPCEQKHYVPDDVISSSKPFCHSLMRDKRMVYCDYCALPI